MRTPPLGLGWTLSPCGRTAKEGGRERISWLIFGAGNSVRFVFVCVRFISVCVLVSFQRVYMWIKVYMHMCVYIQAYDLFKKGNYASPFLCEM